MTATAQTARGGTPRSSGRSRPAVRNSVEGGCRIFLASRHRLFCLDAETGAVVPSFVANWGGGAFDPETRMPLPERSTATPMTYRTGTGRQFVLIATGSGASQELVAFATPE